jgi:hypothetical protein
MRSEAARHLRTLPAPPSLNLPSGTSLHGQVDGMLLDLGISSMQVKDVERHKDISSLIVQLPAS